MFSPDITVPLNYRQDFRLGLYEVLYVGITQTEWCVRQGDYVLPSSQGSEKCDH